jgi:hypothetical protein
MFVVRVLVGGILEEISEIHKSIKNFKSAYSDLKTMCKGALARGEKSVASALKTKEAETAQNSSVKAATDALHDQKRRRSEAAAKASDFFAVRHTTGKEISSHALSKTLEIMPGAEAVDWDLPQILRFPPEFLETEAVKHDIEQLRKTFTDSATKAATGRATHTISEATSVAKNLFGISCRRRAYSA